MVGAHVSVVGSSMVDSKTNPCLSFDILPSCNLNGGDHFVSQRHYSIGKKHVPPRLGYSSLELSSSFLDYSSVKALSGGKKSKKQPKSRRSFVVVSELAGNYEDNFEDVKKQVFDYFTYKAVRTVLNQLYEMNPTQYRWFYDFIATNERGYGKRFIRDLQKEKHELAERVMVTRLHLYGKWIKKCDHTEMYGRISDQNLELMRERLIETVVWPSENADLDG